MTSSSQSPYQRALVRNRAIELAATNPGLTVYYNDEMFLYKKGMSGLIDEFFDKNFVFSNGELEFYIIPDHHNGPEERVFSWVNSSLLYDGGICNAQFINSFVDRVTKHLARETKKRKITLNKNDVLFGLLVLNSLKVTNPQYDSQAKTKLTGPNLRRDIDATIEAGWAKFARANKEWLAEVVERAVKRSNVAATKDVLKNQKGKLPKPKGFMEATSRRREECQLLDHRRRLG